MKAGLRALFCCALMAAAPAAAQEALPAGGSRTLSYARDIGRIEVDREGVMSISAPTARSLRVTGSGQGQAMLRVYDADGGLLEERAFAVAPTAPQGGGIDVDAEQVVAVDVQFAAVSTSTLRALGFNFSKLSGDIQGAVISPGSLQSYTLPDLSINATAPIQNAFNLFLSGPNRGIGAVLSALSSNGLSQLLAQPTLLVRSGEEASFLAGGEVPIPVPQPSGGDGTAIAIQFKEFGVRLSVTPFVLSPDKIVLKVAPEVSELDYDIGVQLQGFVVPGLRRRSAETTVELGSGQSFVIAGLSYSSTTLARDKLPFLGDIPILGALFKRQEARKEQQELIIVATPRLVGPVERRDLPPLPGSAAARLDPTVGDMVLGRGGLEDKPPAFGVVRR